MIVEFLRKHKRDVKEDLDFGMVLNNICRLYVGMLQEFQLLLCGIHRNKYILQCVRLIWNLSLST